MKTLLIATCLWLTALASYAQKDVVQPNLDPTQVPEVVMNKFTTAHPGITAVWKADGENFKAAFNDPATKLGRIIVYDPKGEVLRTDNEVDQNSYPQSIHDYYNKNYPGEKYQVWSSEETGSNEQLYYSGRNLETMWFDKSGARITERKAKAATPKK